MTFYQQIKAVQRPFDPTVLDAQNRVQRIFNITTVKNPSETFPEEVMAVIASGISSLASGVSILHGTNARVPDTGDVIIVLETPGFSPIRTHDDGGIPASERPGAQITVRATTTQRARALASKAYAAMLTIVNTNVVP